MHPMFTEESLRKMAKTDPIHIPVMTNEVLEFLNPELGDIIVDGTLGLGGHSREILKRVGSQGTLIGMDRDAESLAIAKERLKDYQAQCRFFHNNFKDIDSILEEVNISKVDGILLDLGISSFQLDNPDRGFSIRSNTALDMRMNQKNPISAFDLVNSLTEKEIASILHDFGQERWANRIAHQIVLARSQEPIQTTKDLGKAVLRAIPSRRVRQRIHPATRTFQAFRIAVNRELESLEEVLGKCCRILKPQGRVVIISFHSLEDKIVKHTFKEFSRNKDIHILTKKPLRPNNVETAENPRSRSARLRAAERI